MTNTVIVFSHPNHEISVLGMIKRLQPHIVYLTDGGSEERVNETKRGLAAYLPPGNLTFLDRKEPDLYGALLDGDVGFYRGIADEVRSEIERLQPESIYGDAVEFYNPVHDMTLPVVRQALRGRDLRVFEIPLIHQTAAPDKAYELQRSPAALADQCVFLDLTEAELAAKTATLTGGTYQALFQSLGDFILAAVPSHAGREQFLKARTALPAPVAGQVNRYDRRGQEHLGAGLVNRAIGYEAHYVPMYRALADQAT